MGPVPPQRSVASDWVGLNVLITEGGHIEDVPRNGTKPQTTRMQMTISGFLHFPPSLAYYMLAATY